MILILYIKDEEEKKMSLQQELDDNISIEFQDIMFSRYYIVNNMTINLMLKLLVIICTFKYRKNMYIVYIVDLAIQYLSICKTYDTYSKINC